MEIGKPMTPLSKLLMLKFQFSCISCASIAGGCVDRVDRLPTADRLDRGYRCANPAHQRSLLQSFQPLNFNRNPKPIEILNLHAFINFVMYIANSYGICERERTSSGCGCSSQAHLRASCPAIPYLQVLHEKAVVGVYSI